MGKLGWSTLDYLDVLLVQVVEVIDEAVNLRVSGGDLAGERSLFLRRSGGGKLLVQRQHLLHQPHHPVVRRFPRKNCGQGQKVSYGDLREIVLSGLRDLLNVKVRQETAV